MREYNRRNLRPSLLIPPVRAPPDLTYLNSTPGTLISGKMAESKEVSGRISMDYSAACSVRSDRKTVQDLESGEKSPLAV